MKDKNESSNFRIKKTSESIVHAELNRDSLKSIFHILVGKPDSTIRLFDGPFELGIRDIANLSELIALKISTHSVEAINTSVYISSSDNVIKEFGSIKDFLDHNWSGPEETVDISLKWDFLFEIASYEIPQRHTLNVRASKTPNTRETLRRLFADNEDDDPHDLALMPMYCRTDYISPVLGKELINIVGDWHKGLKRPVTVSQFLLKVRKHQDVLAKVIEHTLPITIGLCCISAFRYLLSAFPSDSPVTVFLLERAGLWFSSSIGCIYISVMISKFLAKKSSSYLSPIETRMVAFSLTNGDYNRNQKTIDKSNRNFQKFLFSAGWAIFLNLVAAYIAIKVGISP